MRLTQVSFPLTFKCQNCIMLTYNVLHGKANLTAMAHRHRKGVSPLKCQEAPGFQGFIYSNPVAASSRE